MKYLEKTFSCAAGPSGISQRVWDYATLTREEFAEKYGWPVPMKPGEVVGVPAAPTAQGHLCKNRTTERGRDFWDHVESVASQVRAGSADPYEGTESSTAVREWKEYAAVLEKALRKSGHPNLAHIATEPSEDCPCSSCRIHFAEAHSAQKPFPFLNSDSHA